MPLLAYERESEMQQKVRELILATYERTGASGRIFKAINQVLDYLFPSRSREPMHMFVVQDDAMQPEFTKGDIIFASAAEALKAGRAVLYQMEDSIGVRYYQPQDKNGNEVILEPRKRTTSNEYARKEDLSHLLPVVGYYRRV
jgi:hypothetical protein